jgi:hypothetical protein
MHLSLLTCAEPRARTTPRSQLKRAPSGIVACLGACRMVAEVLEPLVPDTGREASDRASVGATDLAGQLWARVMFLRI